MRTRHRIVEVDPGPTDTTPNRCFSYGDGESFFIDEPASSEPPRPCWLPPVEIDSMVRSATPQGYGVRSATMRPGPMVGNGSHSWPGHDSRLVRLFDCDPERFLDGVVGHRGDGLRLGEEIRTLDDRDRSVGDWPRGVMGVLRMPYAAPPLSVELVCQPFNRRYARVDLVLRSRYRRPRRYFAVAYQCLSGMRWLEHTDR